MTVNRRTVIKQFLFVSAGAVILPACLQEDKGKSSVLLKNFQLSGQQEKTLEELTETIIPATTTPGAKAVYAHLFVLKMLDDCYKKEDQQKFVKGLEQFEKTVQQKFDQPFAKCSKSQRAATRYNGCTKQGHRIPPENLVKSRGATKNHIVRRCAVARWPSIFERSGKAT